MSNLQKRVLITGGTGFIGAQLARRLVAAGHDVHLLVRAEARFWRIQEVREQLTLHRGDLRDPGPVGRAIRAARPEWIFHLATHGGYPAQTDRPAILMTNIQGTAHLLDALRDRDYEALVHAGSSSEYGHKNGPLREDDRLAPRTAYAVAKAAASHLCLAEAHRGKPAAVVRVFSAYGPWEEPGRLVPYVMQCCHRGENPRVTAGHQPRDFIHVDDVVELMVRVAGMPELAGTILNAGTGVQHTVREMVETIVSQCGRGRVKPEFGAEPLRADEPECWVASIEETCKRTGWSPRYDLISGIKETWEWYREFTASRAA